jgi:hypothetical protein
MSETAVPPVPSPSFDNSSVWLNFTAWTAHHLRYVNVTKYAPSLEDLVWAGPRMVMKLGSFISFPDALDSLGQRAIPEATTSGIFDTSAAATAMNTLADTTTSAAGQALPTDQDPSIIATKLSMEGARGLGSVFSYATSKWALSCITMAIILNRTHIFAATRRRLRLRWPLRLVLRCLPIILFAIQARQLLQSIQCQTSPDFAEMRWGNASKTSELMFSQTNAFLHGLSSTLLFGASDQDTCLSVHMIPPDDSEQTPELRGSLSLLWPLFGTFCLSQFLETVSCAVQGRPVAAETGMTLFEHSLAFAEADAAISNQLGWGLFTHSQSIESTNVAGATIAISRSMILKRVNTPPEVLLVAFLSTMSHITSHVLGVFNLQAKFRLVSTGFWGVCFMGSIIWSAITFSLDDPSGQGLLRFPTVCIIGFIPHVLVLGGIIICFSIYILALLLSALAPSDSADASGNNRSFAQRLAHAHGNMQANVSLSDIRITMEMDFYTALLRTGFGAITMASEAVYLNEDKDVNLAGHTWLEDERYRELESIKIQMMAGTPDSRYDSIGTIGLVPVQDGHMPATNGFARERAAQKLPKNRSSERRMQDGVGAAERSGRWLMALEFVMNINRLLLRGWAMVILRILSTIGIRSQPRWLVWLMRPKLGKEDSKTGPREEADIVVELLPNTGGSIPIPRQEHVDVEAELRRRYRIEGERIGGVQEQEVDNKLYGWWLRGGWWGGMDTSGEYAPPANQDDDATSMISFCSTDDEGDWESEDEGQRTPTQISPRVSRESSPVLDNPLQMTDLARLLHPMSPEERDEAQALAAHLSSQRILTRSQYRQLQQLQRTMVLSPGRRGMAADLRAGRINPDEEAQRLEQLLLSRRSRISSLNGQGSGADTWASGAAGLGPDGPQCVVCQSSPRTIIVWPCRCLSLCDDCRVSLAMNNFDKCVCCRREVVSFSRIYVP